MVRSIDLNADVGEECSDDESLLSIVTSANVATGAHAGGGAVLDDTVRMAAAAGCSIGAHPSYRDRENFGRVSPPGGIEVPALVEDLTDQVMLVALSCRRHGVRLRHVKAHGALYNDAARDDVLAAALAAVVQEAQARLGEGEIALVGPPDSALARAAAASGVRFVREAFADRAYLASGALVPRTDPHAVFSDSVQIAQRARAVAEGRPIDTADGAVVVVAADTICLHGDTPGAVHHAVEVRRALELAGVIVAAPETDP